MMILLFDDDDDDDDHDDDNDNDNDNNNDDHTDDLLTNYLPSSEGQISLPEEPEE